MTDLFGHSVRSELLLLCAAEAFLSFCFAYTLLAWGFAPPTPGYAVVIAVSVALCVAVLSAISGAYQSVALPRIEQVLGGIVPAGLTLLVVLAMVPRPEAAISAHPIGQIRLVGFAVAAFTVILFATRLGFLAASQRGAFCRRVVLVRDATGALPALDQHSAAFEVAETVPTVNALSVDSLRAERVWGVVVADPNAVPAALHARCRAAQIRVLDAAEFSELRLNRVDVNTLPPGWLSVARGGRETALEAAIRRVYDISLSLGLLLATLPLLILTAIAVRLDSPGPVLYRQARVGKGGRVFTLLKFRSMVADAERGGAPRWATPGDPRVTRVGRFIRLVRIDELPQVFNVLRGEMAFVGPRPERPGFVSQLREVIPHYDDRTAVKPGITGWAQVNYPYGASVEDARMKLAYDLYYIRRRSIFLDLLILVATVRVVLFQIGAR